MKNPRIVVALCAGIALSTTGCGPGGNAEPAGHSASVNGRVSDGASFAPVANASVTAYVYANGSLQVASETVTTDAAGDYSLTLEFDTETVSDVIVQAEGDAAFEASALLSGTLADGDSATAPPMSAETTLEAEVYVDARAEASWGGASTSAGLRAQIDADIAALIAASASEAADIAACTASVIAGMEARAAMLADESIGLTQAQIDAFLAAETQAQAELDAALDAAGSSQAQIDAAVEVYLDAIAAAYASAGVTSTQLAETVQAQATAAMAAGTALSSAAEAQAVMAAEAAKADAIGAANTAAFTALGAQATVLATIASAQVTLEASIEASAGVVADIETAWANYNAAIEAELRAQVESMQASGGAAIDTVTASLASAQAALDSAVSSAEASLEASLASAGSDVEALADAYGAFSLAVDAAVSGNVTVAQMTSAQVDATVSILLCAKLN